MTRQPKYLTCKEQIKSLILEGDFKVGDRIPSISMLIDDLGSARTNIQKALDLLCEEGILCKKPGSGCYLEKLPETEEGKMEEDTPVPSIDYLSGIFSLTQNDTLRYGILLEMTDHAQLWQQLATQFTQKTGLKLELVPLNSIEEISTLQSPLDVFQVPHYMLPDIVNSGMIHSLNDLDVTFQSNDFLAATPSFITHNNQHWGIPVSCGCSCFYINKETTNLYEQIATAKDLDDFLLKLKQVAPEAQKQGFEAVTKNCYLLPDYLEAAGVVDANYFSHFIENLNESTVSNFLKSFETYFQDADIFHGLNTSYFSAASTLFNTKKLLSIMGNTSALKTVLNNCKCDFSIEPIPVNKNGFTEMSSFINVASSASARLDECASLLNYLQQYETQRHFSTNGRIVAHTKALSELDISGLDSASTQNIIKAMSNSRGIMMDHSSYSCFLQNSLIKNVTLWQRKKITLDNMIHQIQTDFKELNQVNQKVG